jgi:hypothetical protein
MDHSEIKNQLKERIRSKIESQALFQTVMFYLVANVDPVLGKMKTPCIFCIPRMIKQFVIYIALQAFYPLSTNSHFKTLLPLLKCKVKI